MQGRSRFFRGRPFVIYFLVKDLKAFRTFLTAVSTIAPKRHAPLRFSRMYRTIDPARRHSSPFLSELQAVFAVFDNSAVAEY